jgi:hypothetical protein
MLNKNNNNNEMDVAYTQMFTFHGFNLPFDIFNLFL